eukprot:COSAG01_NODE_25575_length_740_cov_2.368175_1_plen_177_part_10
MNSRKTSIDSFELFFLINILEWHRASEACMAGWLLAGFYCSTISWPFSDFAGSAEYSFGRQQLIGLLLLVSLWNFWETGSLHRGRVGCAKQRIWNRYNEQFLKRTKSDLLPSRIKPFGTCQATYRPLSKGSRAAPVCHKHDTLAVGTSVAPLRETVSNAAAIVGTVVELKTWNIFSL